jgi:hypothetical protein
MSLRQLQKHHIPNFFNMSEHQLKLLGKKNLNIFILVAGVPRVFKICYYKETVSENITHPILTILTMT